MEYTATLHAGCELSSATGSGKKSNKGTGEGGDDQALIQSAVAKVTQGTWTAAHSAKVIEPIL